MENTLDYKKSTGKQSAQVFEKINNDFRIHVATILKNNNIAFKYLNHSTFWFEKFNVIHDLFQKSNKVWILLNRTCCSNFFQFLNKPIYVIGFFSVHDCIRFRRLKYSSQSRTFTFLSGLVFTVTH